MSYINTINNADTNYLIAGVSNIIICSTSADTVTKTATAMDGFSLDSNLSFKIIFTNGNTASSPTLNLNDTGAKSLTTTTSDYTLVANMLYDCYYNGSSYVLDNTVTVHTANTSNPHSVTKAQVGLGNCDNTADADKAVKSATNASKLGGYPVRTSSIGGSSTETTNYWTYVTKSKFMSSGGYIKYSNGLIVQWGESHASTANGCTLTFPASFSSSTSYFVSANVLNDRDSMYHLNSTDKTKFSCVINRKDYAANYWQWFAIGYWCFFLNGLLIQWRYLSTTDSYQTEIPFTFLADFSSTPACFGAINRNDSNYPVGTLSIYKLSPKGGSLRIIVNNDYSTSTQYGVFAIGT